MKSHFDLEIYQDSYVLALRIHELTMSLPKYELYELGSQIRRSSKSVVFNITEGYGRRQYKKDFVRFMIFAHASNLEVLSQLRMMSDLHFKEAPLTLLLAQYDTLCKKIYRFIKYIERNWLTKAPP